MANRRQRNPRRQYEDEDEDDMKYNSRGQPRYYEDEVAERQRDQGPRPRVYKKAYDSEVSDTEDFERLRTPRDSAAKPQPYRSDDFSDFENQNRPQNRRERGRPPVPKLRTVFARHQQGDDSEDSSSEEYLSPRYIESQREIRNVRGPPINQPRNIHRERRHPDPGRGPPQERQVPVQPQRGYRNKPVERRYNPRQDRNVNFDRDDFEEDDQIYRRDIYSNKGRRKGDSTPRRGPHDYGQDIVSPIGQSTDEDSEDSMSEVRYSRTQRPPYARDKANIRNEVRPEKLIRILEGSDDLQVTLLNLLEDFQLQTSSVRHLVSTNPHLFKLAGETVKLNVRVKICDAHNGSKGCLNRSECRNLHICSKFVNSSCVARDCVMGHKWKTRHNGNILMHFGIDFLSEESLKRIFEASFSLDFRAPQDQPDICNDYNQGKCQRRNCSYLHICYSYVAGRSKCSKQSCKLNHDLLGLNCCKLLKASGIDTNESPRDVLLSLIDANPSLTKKGFQEKKSPLSPNPKSDTGQNDAQFNLIQAKDYIPGADKSKKEPKKKKKSTAWSYYTKADVDIPEICYNSVESSCPNEGSGCKRLHSLEHYHWQVSDNGTTWLNLQTHQVIALEDSFCDVSSEEATLPRFDPSRQNVSSNALLLLLGRENWKALFRGMKITNSSKSKSYQIRRLSTELVPGKQIKPSSFVWYFLDKQQNWVEYGKVDSLGETNLVSSLSSIAIEKQYLKDSKTPINFQNAKFTYSLDFQAMTQTNQHTNVSREIRRRPMAHLPAEEKDQQEGQSRQLPSNWDQMQTNERLKRVVVQTNSEEYRKTVQLLGNQSSNVINLERVQNKFHWNAFQNKIKEMTSIHGDISKVNIRQLFHGTGHNIVQNICSENFDPRLHGQSAGQAYGQGTYFATDATTSYGYCKADSTGQKYMFVAQVAVGSLTIGNSSMARPPMNQTINAPYDSTGNHATNPTIIVKYDKAEYYPQYIFTLK